MVDWRCMDARGWVAVWVAGAPLGILAGLGLFTFGYARGFSYLTNDPKACVNCHVMREEYAGWLRSSHRKAAVCNDCHTRHALLPKLMTKVRNGFQHAWAFTTGEFPDNIQIQSWNRKVTEEACLHCHEAIASAITSVHRRDDRSFSCLRCHGDVGHEH